jgi:hypothetical protein
MRSILGRYVSQQLRCGADLNRCSGPGSSRRGPFAQECPAAVHCARRTGQLRWPADARSKHSDSYREYTVWRMGTIMRACCGRGFVHGARRTSSFVSSRGLWRGYRSMSTLLGQDDRKATVLPLPAAKLETPRCESDAPLEATVWNFEAVDGGIACHWW